ncbi:biopolymer transporter ExbD [Sulfitobacter albidus]|uniref:Biopolymer transporter ExbD n=1 Tax=Sulfitobacter albidus TaxID=2829501 RepID=A0A975JGI2_9RHOB|nr:biopolymer transporter ExbD [Sulfitobacter albidus]QUJ78112.1 biopolymer transporter ExbD [Sulfitobacter albidus]
MHSRVAPLPARPRSYKFSLTPLADAMFQLLIFFMLTSSLTPFSLVTLRGSPDAAGASEPGAQTPQVEDASSSTPASDTTDTPGITIWTLGDGIVVVNEQIFSRDQLPELAEAIGTQDRPGKIVLLVGDLARVQDVASALDALQAAEVESVQITRSTQ